MLSSNNWELWLPDRTSISKIEEFVCPPNISKTVELFPKQNNLPILSMIHPEQIMPCAFSVTMQNIFLMLPHVVQNPSHIVHLNN